MVVSRFQNQDYIQIGQDSETNATTVGGSTSEAEPAGRDNTTFLGEEFVTSTFNIVRPETDLTEEAAIALVQENLPYVAYIMLGVTVWMLLTVTLSCYRVGGKAFLSAQLCDFCCYLLFAHGLIIGIAGLALHGENPEESQVLAGDSNVRTELSLYNGMLAVAAGMVFTSLLGMFGRKICLMGLVSRFIPVLPKVAAKLYLLLLWLILALAAVFYVVAYYFSQHVSIIVSDNWDNEAFQAQLNRTVAAGMTQNEFITTVQSGYNILAITAAVTVLYVVSAAKSTGYSLKNPVSENLAAQLDDLDELNNSGKKAEIQARREQRKQEKQTQKQTKKDANDSDGDVQEESNPSFEQEVPS